MHSFQYPARFHRERAGGYSITFPDLPEAITGGDDLEDAMEQAADCLGEALSGRLNLRERIPTPSQPKRGMRLVPVPLYLAPKLAVYQAMTAAGVTNAELARRMSVQETIVRRLLHPRRATRPDTIQKALTALGKTVTLTLDDAA
jgi:antitoxin HicB